MATEQVSKPTRTCVVGCKLPNGLIIEMGYDVVAGGVSRTSRYKRQVLNGANQHVTVIGPNRTPSQPTLKPGITQNVDEELFDAWLKQHASTFVVRNGLVFKEPNLGEATAHAAEMAQQRIGLEPVDPSKHPNVGKANFNE